MSSLIARGLAQARARCLAGRSLWPLPTWCEGVWLLSGLRPDQVPFDNPATVGFCDDSSRAYFSSDCFGAPMRTACIDAVLVGLRAANPGMGKVVAIDGSDLPAYANGHKHVGSTNGPLRTRWADPDAAWGHRSAISTRKGGGYYGYKVHAAVDAATGLPLAWDVQPANVSEQERVPGLLDALTGRGFIPGAAVMDKGYDGRLMYEQCEARGIRPVIALQMTAGVQAGKADPPKCVHGTWTFAGSDAKRGAAKWRCPTGKCQPASTWVKADRLHPLIPRGTERFKDLYRQRVAVERELGRLKHEWGMLPLRVRRLPRVRLHVNLTILAQLADAAIRAQTVDRAA